ncbi:hypothetical protein GXW82_05195 [Streptacidiphilus sp. 4-A2]|nr:hypothetical protein [Streptacidiphilus sp. 4-A2]
MHQMRPEVTDSLAGTAQPVYLWHIAKDTGADMLCGRTLFGGVSAPPLRQGVASEEQQCQLCLSIYRRALQSAAG